MKRPVLCLCALGLVASIGAQSAPSPLPQAYTADEFPAWAHELRRWEIVSLGSFPIALFYTKLAFDFARYASNGFDPRFVPWPFKNEFSYAPSAGEQRTMFLSAAAVAAVAGFADWLIVAIKTRAEP
ncbi:MAG TPA: hypothetical protein PLC54_06975 [Spirochaetales bacterium]|nr:hypothetical protein [Spirochaetales bacterium]